MTYVIGTSVEMWALSEAQECERDGEDFGVSVFPQRTNVQDPQGGSATLPVWFAEVTLAASDGGVRIHCGAAGVGEPAEALVRQEVRAGIEKLRAEAARPQQYQIPASMGGPAPFRLPASFTSVTDSR